jgi:hypothetical protein
VRTAVRVNNCFGNTVTSTPPSGPTNLKTSAEPQKLDVNIRPIPTQTDFTLTVTQAPTQQGIQINVYDINGRRIQQLSGSILDSYHFGNSYAQGTYLVEVLQGSNRVTKEVLKQ